MTRDGVSQQAQRDRVHGVIALDTPASPPEVWRARLARLARLSRLAARPQFSVAVSLVIFALSLGVGVYQAGTNSVWLDEAFSVEFSQLPWTVLWTYIWGVEAHMGLYYVLLRGWIWLLSQVGFAPTELAIRLPSLICVASSAVIVYQFGRRFLGNLAGVMSALLFLMNFLVLIQGNEARSYGMQLLFVCASWYAMVRALSDGASRRWWIAYAVFGSLQIYAQLFSVLILGAQMAAFLCLFALGPHWRANMRRDAKWMAISVACILTVSAPILSDALLHGGGNGWIPPAQWSDLVALFNPLGGGMLSLTPLLIAIGVLELALVLLARAPGGGRQGATTARVNRLLGGHPPTLQPIAGSTAPALAILALCCWLALPIMLAFVLTQPSLNIHLFHYAYFAICAPAYCLLAGLCVAVTRWRYAQVILALVLIAFSLRVLPTAQDSSNYDAWHASALWLEQQYTPGDGIICVPDTWCAVPLDYYLFAYPSQAHFDSDSPGAWVWAQEISNPTTADALAAYTAQHDRVFLVTYNRTDFGAASLQDQQIASVKSWLTAHDWQARSFSASTYLSTITVTMYVRLPTSNASSHQVAHNQVALEPRRR